jgi:hypothetical protein
LHISLILLLCFWPFFLWQIALSCRSLAFCFNCFVVSGPWTAGGSGKSPFHPVTAIATLSMSRSSIVLLLNVFHQNIKPFICGLAFAHTFQWLDGGAQFLDELQGALFVLGGYQVWQRLQGVYATISG